MILYREKDKEKVAYIRCDCMAHGIEIDKIDFEDSEIPNDICISLYTDNFYSKQYGFFRKWKDKIVKIFYILLGKGYKIEDDIVLSENDLEEFIKALKLHTYESFREKFEEETLRKFKMKIDKAKNKQK